MWSDHLPLLRVITAELSTCVTVTFANIFFKNAISRFKNNKRQNFTFEFEKAKNLKNRPVLGSTVKS